MKTFKYQLYPTKKQIHLLNDQLEECRWLYNHFLGERKQAWEERQESISQFDQNAELPSLKVIRPTLKDVHAQVTQNITARLQDAMDAFFRRRKTHETPGYPRFKGRGRYDSITFPQVPSGCHMTDEHTLYVSKIGDIKTIYHRPLEGKPKTATITRTSTGKWFVTIACEWEPTALPPTEHEVGIDVGLKTFATCSDGVEVANQRFFRTEEKALAKSQRKHQLALDAHKAKRTAVTKQVKQEHPNFTDDQTWQQVSQDADEHTTWKVRQRRRKVVARVHERITWRRDNFTHRESRKLVNTADLIVVEDLSITNMVKNPKFARSIHDVAWGQFAALLRIKAAWAGRLFIAVNPAYSSTDCSQCGHRKTDLRLADRIYHCDECGLEIVTPPSSFWLVDERAWALHPRSLWIYPGESSQKVYAQGVSMPEIFTREQAEALLPALSPLLRSLQAAWDELVDATTASTLLRERMIGDGHAYISEMQSLTRRVETARQSVATLVARIRAYGCDLKDPRSGLIDFPAQLFGRMVYLCWHLGEPRISWWHDIDSGFTGRQPLD